MAKKHISTPAVLATASIPESGRITVACKLPHGLQLQLYDMEEGSEPVMGGGTKTVKRAVALGDSVKLNGVAVPFGKMPNYMIVGGYALTPNVDAQFFRRWMNDNQDSPIVKNKLILVHEDQVNVTDAAKDHDSVRSGLEPITPDKDPRIPRAVNPNLSAITTEQKAAA